MFLLVSGRHVGAHADGHQHGVSIQISINLGKKFLRISRVRKIAVTRILARVFAYLPSFISQILDFIYWPVLIFILIYFELRDTENQQLRWLNTVFDTCVHSPFSLKLLIPRSPKMAASKLTTQTLVFWWLGWRMCRCHGNMTKYNRAFKIGFVYL